LQRRENTVKVAAAPQAPDDPIQRHRLKAAIALLAQPDPLLDLLKRKETLIPPEKTLQTASPAPLLQRSIEFPLRLSKHVYTY